MRNERGLTLVELLAVLALVGIIMTLLISIFINGSKASNRIAINQQLQQEANYITEVIQAEYLKRPEEIPDDEYKSEIKLTVENEALIMNGKIISEGYIYRNMTETITRTGSQPFTITIVKDDLEFPVDTRFSKLE